MQHRCIGEEVQILVVRWLLIQLPLSTHFGQSTFSIPDINNESVANNCTYFLVLFPRLMSANFTGNSLIGGVVILLWRLL